MAMVVAATLALGGAASAHAETISFTGSGGAVPDNTAAGASFDISVPDARVIRTVGSNVTLTLLDVGTPAANWFRSYGGLVDFTATLEHVGSGPAQTVFADVLNLGSFICAAGLAGTYTFRSGEPTTLRSQCGDVGVGLFQPELIPPGTYLTTAADDTTDSGLSSAWNGQAAAGVWRLHIRDVNTGTNPNQFVLNTTWSWRLDIELAPFDLALAKSDSADPVTVGDAFTYTLTVSNKGPEPAPATTVTDTLPAAVSYNDSASDARCDQGPTGAVTCGLGTLAAGASETVVIGVSATAAGTATNTATVASTEPDPTPADNTVTEQTTINTPAAQTTINTPAAPTPAAPAPACVGRQPTIVAQPGVVTQGTAGRDVIVGTAGSDRIRSGKGNDLICARAGADTISSGHGRDRINAGSGRDRVSAGAGNDRINPGPDRDRVNAGPGNDRLGLPGLAADVGNCGPGRRDRAIVDQRERTRNCEIVRRVRR
jgi:uncharacterized repeat protein (TIGR01451 family)